MIFNVLTCVCLEMLRKAHGLMLQLRTEHNSKLKTSFSGTPWCPSISQRFSRFIKKQRQIILHCTWFINTCVYLWLPFITGAEKKTRTPDEQVNWTTAIHEAGHTIVGLETKTSAKNVYKVTIKSRRSNQSLGHVSVIGRVGCSMVSLECGTYFYTKKIILYMFPC